MYFLNPIFKPLLPSSVVVYCTAWFMYNLVGNFEDRFSGDVAHMVIFKFLNSEYQGSSDQDLPCL